MGIVRITFGLIWAVDAWFKWQPSFLNGLPDYLSGSLEGQPLLVQSWINIWLHTVHINPTFFAYLVAVGETAIAVGLIFGVFSNLTNGAGLLLSVVIWTTAEGFGARTYPARSISARRLFMCWCSRRCSSRTPGCTTAWIAA